MLQRRNTDARLDERRQCLCTKGVVATRHGNQSSFCCYKPCGNVHTRVVRRFVDRT